MINIFNWFSLGYIVGILKMGLHCWKTLNNISNSMWGKIYKAWNKSKWQICFYLWKWNAHYLHYTCIEKWFIWLYFWISLINIWWIYCAKKHIQNQDLHQDISSRIGCLEPIIIWLMCFGLHHDQCFKS